MRTITVTTDTVAMGPVQLPRLQQAANRLPIKFAFTTVTGRELAGTRFTVPTESPVRETMVWGESRWGEATWGGAILEPGMTGESYTERSVTSAQTDAELFEALLKVMSGGTPTSGGSFPKPQSRSDLNEGLRHMMRDAMILVAHTREERDILVSNDVKAFGKPASKLRKSIEALCRPRIMTVDEFCSFCKEWEHTGTQPKV